MRPVSDANQSLCTHDLCKKFGKKTALHDVNIELRPGKIYGLLGRNGAGKTTLMHVLAGQSRATSGRVELGGEPVWENPGVSGKVFCTMNPPTDSKNPLARLTMGDYLASARILLPAWDAALQRDLTDLFELDPSKRLGECSSGQLRAVSAVAALAGGSQFTLLDEPLANLDAIARRQLCDALLDVYGRTGRTFVLSTHIVDEVASLFEETIVLHHGAVLLAEETTSLLERAFLVSGLASEVDRATDGLETHHPFVQGRRKSVTVLLRPGQTVTPGCDVTLRAVGMRELFIALCSDGAGAGGFGGSATTGSDVDPA